MLLAIPFALFGYIKANRNGRNGFLWGTIAAGTFIITQLAVSLFLGIIIGVILGMRGGTNRDYDAYNIPVTILAIMIGIITGMLVLRHLDKISKEDYLSLPSEF